MSFHVGQKVVCVITPVAPFYLEHCPQRPEKGQTYIIRALDYYCGGEAVFLLGINNPARTWSNLPFCEPGFHAGHFELLIERSTETGMAILKKIADDASRKRELTVCGND